MVDWKNNSCFRTIRELGGELCVDEQRSGLLCPNCRGGAESEVSLSLSRTATGISYCCHRDKCGWKGHIPMIASVSSNEDDLFKRERVLPEAKKFYGKLEELPEEIRIKLTTKYFLTEAEIQRAGWLWSPDMDGGRVCMPICSRFARNIGHSFRSLDKRKRPKNRNILTATGEPLMSWYKSVADPAKGIFGWSLPVVMVEDQISALRVSKFANAVSLMGTNLNNEKVLELRKCQAPSFILALDEDATQTAVRYKRQFDELFPGGLKMVYLKRDLKDCHDDEIKTVLNL